MEKKLQFPQKNKSKNLRSTAKRNSYLALLFFVVLFSFTTVTAQCPAQGDQTTYGINSWIGYVYADIDANNPPQNTFSTTYRGFITQPEIFDQNLASNAISGVNLCGSYSDRFSIRFKMRKNFPAGYYTITVGGDDGYRLSLDGGSTFVISDWNYHSYQSTSNTFYLSGDVYLVLENYDQGGLSQVSFTYASCLTGSTAPTNISGTTLLCSTAGGTSLTASGGVHASGATYQWGTGTEVGSNIISGQTNASMYVNPTSTTTYWVRRIGGTCNITTSGTTLTVSVAIRSTQPSISGGNITVCGGSPVTLTATGGTHGTNAVYEWGTGYNAGQNIILGQTSGTLTINPTVTSGYWVRRVDAAPCNTSTGHSTTTITVYTNSSAPTSITGNTAVCSGSNTTLTATGGTSGTNATFQWGTGSVIGSNIINGQTNASITVNPTTNTTYWVRRVNSSICNTSTDGVIQEVTVSTPSTAPTGVTGTTTICSGTSTTLTANGGTMGTNGQFQWGTGNTAGNNIIAGENTNTITVSPASTTVYWVRRIAPAPCSTPTSHSSVTVTVHATSTAPHAITGNTFVCSGSTTTLTATGGISGTNATFQWGTGSIIGSNIINGQTNASLTVNVTTTTTYWVRRVNSSICNSTTDGVTQVVTVSTPSTAPTGISGTVTICNGSSTTLTATGGSTGTNGYFQWGTGNTLGNNIIAGENTNTITVSPTSTTVYWVRRVSPSPCATSTNGTTRTVTVVNTATAPTSISGGTTYSCNGSSTTLTAVGGSGSTYQWGTGSVIGSNIISGQTGVSINVNPTITTNYWVRRASTSPCTGFSAAATTQITITNAPGNPTEFGNNVWNTYGYSTGDISLATATYAGYYVVTDLGFNTQSGSNSWSNTSSPSSASGWVGCSVPVDNFTLSVKRKGFPCGTYTLTLPDWDDEARVYLNGNLVWSCNSWNQSNACSSNIGTYNLNADSTIEVRIREHYGSANVSFTLTQTSVAPTAPTAISGTTTVCPTFGTNLTATGGIAGTSPTYQWGKGNIIGTDVIEGEISEILHIIPSETTTYWVRRFNTVCNTFTDGVAQTVTVTQGTIAGTLSTNNSAVCKNTLPSPIELSGNLGNVVKWQYASNSNFTAGVTDILTTATTLSGVQIGYLNNSRYFRALVQNGSCTAVYTTPLLLEIPNTVVWSNGSWNGIPNETTPVIIADDLILTENLSVCSCQVTGSKVLTVSEGVTLLVQGDITVANTGNIYIEDTGSLVQVDNNAVNVGKITMMRKTTPMKPLDYTYWSSPVQGWKLNQLSPNTSSSKFFSYNPINGNWAVHTGGLEVMQSGKGYIVRAPNGWSLTNASQGVYQGSFVGQPNNGVIPVPAAKGSNNFNLIGNPYPSAIDIDKFILDPTNAAIFEGTVYLWTHNTAISNTIPGNQVYNYTSDDYAAYNLTGGVKTASTAVTGGVTPTGKIAAGQAFFIDVKPTLANGNYSGVFSNEMRVIDQNNQFFRTSNDIETPLNEKNRLWLTISNTTGAYHETLLGYLEGATNEIDYGFDGKFINGGNFVSIYSILNSNKLAIQGRALPFNQNEIIPLGYSSTISGLMSISIENFDGFFSNQTIYLHDYVLGINHHLNDAPYHFEVTPGTFDTRFELRFVDETLGVENPWVTQNTLQVIKSDNKIEVRSISTNIESIYVYDVTGKQLAFYEDINTETFRSTSLNIANQVLLLKIILEDNQIVTRKLVF